MESNIKNINFVVPEELYYRVKLYCCHNKITIKHFIQNVLEEYLDNKKDDKK